jgi:predicted transcriptional regulator
MATSVKVDEGTKDRLERLQAEIKLETGRRVTQQELLRRIVQREFESRDALVDSYRDDFEGLSEEEIEQWLSGTSDWGVETSEEDIDEILYEQEALPDADDE